MKLSVVIPVHNEEAVIQRVTDELIRTLSGERIAHEVVLVDDNSTDSSGKLLDEMASRCEQIRVVHARPPKGFGRAISLGLGHAAGECVVIYMGDGSDHPHDVLRYYEKLQEGYDCVFGSRFIKGAQVAGYPRLKLLLNRMGNLFIQALFMIGYNDVSNAFKGYKSAVIRQVEPLVSQYFNITVELPLKAIIRGFSYAVIPIRWNGRQSGVSKYRIRELSRKYFFSILYVWLEKMLLKEEIRQ